MNTYQAIMAAADHIEQHPKLFRFAEPTIPHACGSPGCALGFIGLFAGIPKGRPFDYTSSVTRVAHEILGIGERTFYDRMLDIADAQPGEDCDWQGNAQHCAECLRVYAAKYHAPLPVVDLPAAVRAIFDREFSVSQS